MSTTNLSLLRLRLSANVKNIPLRDNIYSEVKIYAINNVNYFNHQFILPDGSVNDTYAVEPCEEPFDDSD